MAATQQTSDNRENVIRYVIAEVQARNEYKRELEATPEYLGNVKTKKRRNQELRQNLTRSIDSRYQTILAITKKHFPDVDIDNEPEITIANLLAVLPNLEQRRTMQVVNARGMVAAPTQKGNLA